MPRRRTTIHPDLVTGRYARTSRSAPAGGGGGTGTGGQGDPGGQGGGTGNPGSQGATPPAGSGGQGGATPPAPGQQQGQPGQQGTQPPATGGSDDPLGPPGMRALEAERARNQAMQQQLNALTAERDQLRSATQTEQERAVAAAKAEGRTEAEQAGNQHLVSAELRALAAAKGFHSPADAPALLAARLSEVTVTNGVPDAAKAEELITALSTSHPHLIRQPGTPQFATNPGQGTPPGGATPAGTLDAGKAAYEARKAKTT